MIPISQTRVSTDAKPALSALVDSAATCLRKWFDIVLPSLGDIDEVEVTEICVAVGDLVSAEDSIIVIESDKASMEVPAGHQGTVTELHVSVGDLLNEGAVIGTLTESGSSNDHRNPLHSQRPKTIRWPLWSRRGSNLPAIPSPPMPLGNRLCRYRAGYGRY